MAILAYSGILSQIPQGRIYIVPLQNTVAAYSPSV